MDYAKMLAYHRRSGADLTVAAVSVPIENAHQFGIVTTDAADRIVNFVEKPARPEINLVSMGTYVFNYEIMAKRLSEDAERHDSVHDFGRSILPEMVARDRVYAYRFADYWRDIGTPEAYHAAHLELTGGFCRPWSESWPIVSVEKAILPAATSDSAGIDSVVSQRCIVKGQIRESVLSPGVWIGERSSVFRSVIMSGVSIGKDSQITNCILGEGVTIGDHCQVGSSGPVFAASTELTIIKPGMKIPSYSVVKAGGEIQNLGRITCPPSNGLLDLVGTARPYSIS
jgi:glucose-1-phosphate adenylyltransferase